MTEFANARALTLLLTLAASAWACGEDALPSSAGTVAGTAGGGGDGGDGGQGAGASGGAGGSQAGAGGVGGGGEGGGAGGSGPPFCGDGVVQSGEGCDDGNHENDDSCPDDMLAGGDCQPATCGDGHVWSTDGGTETCDDANGDDTDDCPDSTCVAATCNDGLWHKAGSGDEVEPDCGGSCGPCTRSLLLTEIVLGPTGAELVEIHNPGLVDVPLENVYLADYADYYLITQGMGAPVATDFRVTFPVGSVVPAGGHVVVATGSATSFASAYGAPPNFDFEPADAGAPVMIGELTDNSRLGGTQEMLVLFYWDGASELVTDIDYLVWGNTSAAMNKSNVIVGASTYAAETPPAMQSATSTPPANVALARCLYAEGAEVRGGGNGFAGADETSEDHANTWRNAPPTPGTFNGCSTLAAVAPGAAELHYVDRGTYADLQTVPIRGDSVAPVGVVSIARHPVNGHVFIVVKDANTLRHLARLNVATGRAHVVGQLSDSVAAIAFDPAGVLHGMTGDGALVSEDFVTIDPTTAVATSALSLQTNACCGEALAFNPNDGLFYRFTGLAPALLQSIDAAGPTALDVSYTGAAPAEVTGAFWDGDAGVFVVFDGTQKVLTVAPDGAAVDTGVTTTTKLRGGLIP